MSRFSLLLLRISSGLLLPVVLLLAGAVFAGQMLSSNALLFMNGPDHFTLHDWSLQLRISFDLATDQRQRSIEDFQWLPDGRHLVFNRSVDGTLFEPFLYDLYSREIIPLDMATPDNHLPVWSAVTERWAWAASRDLMCISIRGDERSTCNNFEGAQHLTWSPDGQSLAFFEELRSRLLVLNVIDSEVVVLDTGSEPLNAVPLTWSADSRSLAFLQTGRSLGTTPDEGNTNTLVELQQVDGRWQPAIRTPVALQYPADMGYTIDHHWSPDGQQFAFSVVQSIREQNFNELYIFFRDSYIMQQLTTNFSQEIHPRWSADSSLLAYLENANGFPYLVVRSAASDYRDSTVFPIFGFNLDWRP